MNIDKSVKISEEAVDKHKEIRKLNKTHVLMAAIKLVEMTERHGLNLEQRKKIKKNWDRAKKRKQ